MTVAEMIDVLKDMPQEAKVINCYNGEWGEVERVYKTEDTPSFYYDGYRNCVVVD